MSERFGNPTPTELRALLRSVACIAVVGLSPKPARPSHRVAAAMQGFGYRIVPVRPAIDAVLGERAYPDLYALDEVPELVNVFRAPVHVGPIVDACLALGVPALWLQDGVINSPEAERARAGGMTVVMDRCIYRDYLELLGAP